MGSFRYYTNRGHEVGTIDIAVVDGSSGDLSYQVVPGSTGVHNIASLFILQPGAGRYVYCIRSQEVSSMSRLCGSETVYTDLSDVKPKAESAMMLCYVNLKAPKAIHSKL